MTNVTRRKLSRNNVKVGKLNKEIKETENWKKYVSKLKKLGRKKCYTERKENAK